MENDVEFGRNIDVVIPGTSKKLRVIEQLSGLDENANECTYVRCMDFGRHRSIIVKPDILVQGVQKHDEETKVDYMVSVLNDEQHPIDSFVCTSEVKFYKRISKLLRQNLHKMNSGDGLLFSVYRHEHGGKK